MERRDIQTVREALGERYRFERELGRGGMATVYLAEDRKHGRRVAIKVLEPGIAAAIGPERFLREIEIAAKLNHPHVLPLFDSGAAGGLLYYVMPCIEGESLRARLDREKQLPVEDALRLAREIASGLGHAHARGLVHRDVKPENILLSEGMALVADFGVARATAGTGGRGLTTAGTAIGTPVYMSPEQAMGSADVDGRADLYSLGCVLYEMLGGEPPFTGPTAQSVLYQHESVPPRQVTDLRPSVPAGVAAVLTKVLAKLPADRYPTAARFAEALAAAPAGAPTPAPPGAEDRIPNNLPRERTHFIGRERDLAECARLLEETRLLTITGIGGAGKTRLAQKLAGSLLAAHPDGAWFVDLAPLTEAELVPDAVAAPLGVRDEAGRSTTEMLRARVEGKRMLLVLDNCEHLVAPCAELADVLLDAGDGLRIVATSREGLGVEGERIHALRSLAVPAGEVRDPARAAESESVSLFVDRARLALPAFALTGANAAHVVEICRRLDGIPLAIELAAARMKTLSVDQIRDRLDDRFRLLTGGSRTTLPRQRTLEAALQWSYDQLSGEEQRFLRWLSVFPGGATLESATRVTGGGADEFEVLELLTRLVDKSLVVVEREGGEEPRYGLLETVRQYGLKRLAETGETEAARRGHATEFLDMAERAYAERIAGEAKWAPALAAEHDNLRGALGLLRETDPERYLELAGALAWFWQARSHFVEGRDHLTAALARSAPGAPRPAQARALWGAASVMTWQGSSAAALPLMEDALRIWRAFGDSREAAIALEGMGWAKLLGGDDAGARDAFAESLRLAEELGDPVLVNRERVALAQVLVAREELETARALSREILAFSRAHEDRRNEHFGLHFLADCALLEEKCGEAVALYRESLVCTRGLNDRLESSFEVQGVAMSLAGLGEARLALRLAGAAEAEWERIGADVHMKFWDALRERWFGLARRALGEEEADRAWQEGRNIPFEDALDLALGARETKGGPA